MKKLLAVLATLTLAVTLASCGGKEAKVTFWHTMGKENQTMLDEMIKKFNVIHPDIKIDHAAQGGYPDINDKIKKALPANTYPTMAFVYPDHVADYLGKNFEGSKVVPLNDLMDDKEIGINKADYVPSYLAEGLTYGTDTYYSMPFSKSTEVLYYNKTYFDANKWTVPTTWDEFEILAAKMKPLLGTKKVLGYDSSDNLFITMTEQMGTPYTSSTAPHYLFDTPENKAMVTKLNKWYKDGWLTTKEMLNGDYTSNQFVAQSLYMSVGSTGGTKYNIPKDDADGNPTFEVAISPLPQMDVTKGKAISQGPSIAFFKKSDAEVRAAWEFYKFITNPENSANYAIFTGYEPVNTKSYDTDAYKALLEKDDIYARVAKVTREITSWPFTSPAFRGSTAARKQVGIILTDVFGDKYNVENAFKEAMKVLQF